MYIVLYNLQNAERIWDEEEKPVLELKIFSEAVKMEEYTLEST